MVLSTAEVYIGVDLGQRVDHSTIAVVERQERTVAYLPPEFECLWVRYLERLPLGTPYADVVERIREIVQQPKLGSRKKLVVDATGVGGPVVELLRDARLECPLTAVTLTGGGLAHGDGIRWNVPKKDVLTSVLLLLEQGKLKIAGNLRETPRLFQELTQVDLRFRPGGRIQMAADGAGEHDDLVMAVALACWVGRKARPGWTRACGY